MNQYSDFVYYTGTNNPVVNAEVSVYIANTQTLATLYGPNGAVIQNPVTTDQTGYFTFLADVGIYDIYCLGVKQYQVSITGLAGIPDPLITNKLLVGAGITETPGSIGQFLGRVLIKLVDSYVPSNSAPLLKIIGSNDSYLSAFLSVENRSDSQAAPSGIWLMRSKYDHTSPTAGDYLGTIAFGSALSSGFAAQIVAVAENNLDFGTDSARLLFTTKYNGGGDTGMILTARGNLMLGGGFAQVEDTSGLFKFQLVGGSSIIGKEKVVATGYTVPYTIPTGFIYKGFGNTENNSSILHALCANLLRGTGSIDSVRGGIKLARNQLSGALVVPDTNMGSIEFGTMLADGSFIATSGIEAIADSNHVTPSDYSTSLRFRTRAPGDGEALQRMMISPLGSLLLGVAGNPTLVNKGFYMAGQMSMYSGTADPSVVWPQPGGIKILSGGAAGRPQLDIYSYYDSPTTYPTVNFFRGTTAGGFPTSGMVLGQIQFGGAGTLGDVVSGGSIQMVAAENHSLTASGAHMIFKTQPLLNAGTPVERMRIKADGTINMANVATYATNTAAKAAGKVAGDIYKLPITGDNYTLAIVV